MAPSDPVTSIPVHASTLDVLRRHKTGAQNWDEFLLSIFEDVITPAERAELRRRQRAEPVLSGREAARYYEGLVGRRGR